MQCPDPWSPPWCCRPASLPAVLSPPLQSSQAVPPPCSYSTCCRQNAVAMREAAVCCSAARLGAMIHSLSSPGPRNTMGSGSGVKHKLGAGNSAETLNEFVFIYLWCLLFTRIFNCRTRGQESQLSCFDVCRVPGPGPVDDKFICLIPTSHAIQHQRRPQTFS